MLFQNGERVVFMGDSVTDFGRGRPVGEGIHDGVGTGYVRIIHSFINAFYPEISVRLSNMGISGNNILHLKQRWDEDCLALNPDWVSVLIGINDVWRKFDSPSIFDSHISLETYECTYRELIEKTLPKVKGMILMTPFYIELLEQDEMKKDMVKFGDVVKSLAREYKLICVDTQAVFDEYLKQRHSSFVTWDRVHPNQTGAMLIAAEFLRCIGFDKKVI